MNADAVLPYGPGSLSPGHTRRLERDRRRNDLRLKGTFEHIFDKYTKDFSHIGDEIDLETGRIVINNGHIRQMRHERDVGNTPGHLVRYHGPHVAVQSDDSDEDELSITRSSAPASSVAPQTPSDNEEDFAEDEGNTVSLYLLLPGSR